MSAEARLKELGIVLPELRKPVANYLPYRLAGNILYLAGQGPLDNGKQLTGKLGHDVSVEEGYRRARLVGLGLLAAMRDALGTLDRVDYIVKFWAWSTPRPTSTTRRRSSTAAPICSSKFLARPAGMPARRSATSCCPTRFRSRSKVSSRSRRRPTAWRMCV